MDRAGCTDEGTVGMKGGGKSNTFSILAFSVSLLLLFNGLYLSTLLLSGPSVPCFFFFFLFPEGHGAGA